MKKLLLTILLLLLAFSIYAQNHHWKEQTITKEDGLYSDAVRCMLKDSRGFMWFGTPVGLQRYDSHQFRSFKNGNSDRNPPSNTDIRDLVEDRHGNIWIATPEDGLYKYDPDKDNFQNFLHDSGDTNSISNNRIERVYVDNEGTVWAGTAFGLCRFNEVQGGFSRYLCNADTLTNPFGNDITCIYEDRSSDLWIGTKDLRLHQMNRERGSFYHYPIDTNGAARNWIFITCIYEDHTNVLWVGTLDGMYHFDRETKTYTRVLHDPSNLAYPKNQQFTAIVQDMKNNFWVRTYDGLYHYDKNLQLLDTWKHFPYSPIPDPWINLTTILPDSSGIIWYSLHYEGVRKLIPSFKRFHSYQAHPDIEVQDVFGFFVENKDIIWIATRSGLSLFNRKDNTYHLFQHDPSDPSSISSDNVREVFKDRSGILWIATADGLNRLVISEDSTYRFVRYYHHPNDPNSIEKNFISNIFEGFDGQLYFDLAYDHIDVYERETDSFLHVRFPQQKFQKEMGFIKLIEHDKIWYANPEGLLELHLPIRQINANEVEPSKIILHSPEIQSIDVFDVWNIDDFYRDSKGIYWIATGRKGLLKWTHGNSQIENQQATNFTQYSTGFISDEVSGIIEDNKGILWMGNQLGISTFDPVTEAFTHYNRTDGLTSSSYRHPYKRTDGELFFQSDDGLLTFYPDSIQSNPFIPPVLITDLQLFNKSLPVGDDSPLQTGLSRATEITLQFNQNFLSFEFAALNYIHSEQNQYKYMMEGLDQDWIEAGTRRYASYPDLKPGEYTFRVIGSNNDNIWNPEGTSLNITILPPWWGTSYAYIAYGFLALMMVLGYVRLRTWQIRKERDKLESKVIRRTEQIEAQKELLESQNQKIREMDQMKTRFFTNLSHEFRTPLTMIREPVHDLMEKARLNKKEYSKLLVISRNAQRLLNLINQLLDIAKLESGTMKLKLNEGDVTVSLRTIAGAFSSLAETKGIVYNRLIPKEALITWFDPGILEKILTNLLSNAFKFTPEAGEITFSARLIRSETSDKPDQIECALTDQGPGIPIEDREKIFTRFYQVQGSESTMGTGIGLSLVKDLVQLCHGDISVKSEEGKGSTFMIKIPVGKDHLKESECVLVEETAEDKDIQADVSVDSEAERASEKPVAVINGSDKPIVLIVDDNSDIRTHIREHLEDHYKVVESVNGKAGLIKALDIIPDLVITDLMMPVMD